MSGTGHWPLRMVALASPSPAEIDLRAWYEAHLDDVWRVLERLGVPSAHLEDAAQETFIIAHRQRSTFRGDGSPKSWLLGIAVRVAKDARRTHARKSPWEPWDAHAETASVAPGPEVDAMNRQALAQVLALVEQLPDAQREVLVLVDLEGLTAPEVSEVTGVPLNTVYTRLRTARLRFEALVDAAGEGER